MDQRIIVALQGYIHAKEEYIKPNRDKITPPRCRIRNNLPSQWSYLTQLKFEISPSGVNIPLDEPLNLKKKQFSQARNGPSTAHARTLNPLFQ